MENFRILALLALLLAVPVSANPGPDFDKSCRVDFPDFILFAGAFGTQQARFDLTSDCQVDFVDFLAFAAAFGNPAPECPPTTTPPVAEPDTCGNEIGNGFEIISGPDGPSGPDRDNAFRSLAVHPTDANTLLLGTERNGFVKSTDGGQTWARLRKGLRHFQNLYPEIWDIAFDPAHPETLYAASLDSPGPVTGDFPSSVGGVYKSSNGGATWQRANCGLSNSRITSVLVDPNTPGSVLIGVGGGTPTFTQLQGQFFEGGLYHSVNGGDHWTGADLAADGVKNGFRRILHRADRFFTFGANLQNAGDNLGFLQSTDGATWEPFADTLRASLITGFDISPDGQIIYANARDSFFIHISTDGGTTWTRSPINQANGPVAVSPSDPRLVLYAGSARLYRSSDGLETVQQVLEAGDSITDIVFAPSDPRIVYAIAPGYLLYKSTDAGATFALIKNIRTEVLDKQP